MELQVTKVVGGLLMPLPVILFLFIVGLALLAGKRRSRVGAFVLILAFLLLSAVSAPFVGERALGSLEGVYPRLEEPVPEAEWIVVLGGGQWRCLRGRGCL